MKISFSQLALPKSGAIALTVAQDAGLGRFGAELDERTGGLITRAMQAGRFTGKAEETLTLLAPTGVEAGRILLVGIGNPAEATLLTAANAGGAALGALLTSGETEVAIAVDSHDGLSVGAGEMAAEAAFGAVLRGYRFDRYRTKEPKEKKPSVRKVAVLSDEPTVAKKAWARLEKIADGVCLTRDVVSEPGNVIYPETLAERCQSLKDLGVEVEVLDEKKMKKLGMGALLGVGQGSARPPRLVVMRWNGAADAKEAPVAFVGKGITFDTGGISIKPAGGMEEMKWDMAGAGAVIGLMAAVAGRKARANVVGVVALAENMPDGNAQRPGDIVTSLSGQTIEVLNTDAEGRLVLADALWYTQEQFKPKAMIDLATLTGAIIVSLGHEHAGLFSNNDELADKLAGAGRKAGELLWRMPLAAAYDKDIDSDAADMKNIGSPGKAGSITAAQFLQRFVNGTPWAHLDIAGTAWSKADKAVCAKGATGFGVRLLDRFVAENYEV
ncbi:leucyl aminopeptidase [Rhodospirillum centenum]|uniref:Probable cytosol aminopeptidase n=1 Tax=Rhodospirillum centenum (strain ATCC 51521 / SW) TaxID=414684 RepID=B6IN72_RHOCS|nr:leucyl aminopeptidase [Rhodospirillum centenum]ACI98969.1 leucyl aminopeptidase PepA, putative [Rhodospirillum centenum SW]